MKFQSIFITGLLMLVNSLATAKVVYVTETITVYVRNGITTTETVPIVSKPTGVRAQVSSSVDSYSAPCYTTVMTLVETHLKYYKEVSTATTVIVDDTSTVTSPFITTVTETEKCDVCSVSQVVKTIESVITVTAPDSTISAVKETDSVAASCFTTVITLVETRYKYYKETPTVTTTVIDTKTFTSSYTATVTESEYCDVCYVSAITKTYESVITVSVSGTGATASPAEPTASGNGAQSSATSEESASDYKSKTSNLNSALLSISAASSAINTNTASGSSLESGSGSDTETVTVTSGVTSSIGVNSSSRVESASRSASNGSSSAASTDSESGNSSGSTASESGSSSGSTASESGSSSGSTASESDNSSGSTSETNAPSSLTQSTGSTSVVTGSSGSSSLTSSTNASTDSGISSSGTTTSLLTGSVTASTTSSTSFASNTGDLYADIGLSPNLNATFAREILDYHNVRRVIHQAPELRWNKTLYDYAQAYADNYQCGADLVHSGGSYGENLAKGYSTPLAGAQAWYNEGKDFVYGLNSLEDAGHFTAMIWASTTQLGCAYKDCGTERFYLICSYYKAGNGRDLAAQNVLAPTASISA